MKVYLGADHGGFELKEKIKEQLVSEGYEVLDLGNDHFDFQDDYPDFAFKVAEAVSKDLESRGILFCRSAAGMIIAANKVKNVRATAVWDLKSAIHSRDNNDANIIGLSGDWLSDDEAREIVKIWLTTKFNQEKRHVRRIEKISNYERLASRS
ncbi:RpiB/LacA/LacB family sugar-phosphate isomerase [Candidatus Gottesmanbacteria bacterium]|nr:RpiB/LacA/LacB family sugar-phosphate isomerase [Candidatus Gottesmanbacteria bacterium]